MKQMCLKDLLFSLQEAEMTRTLTNSNSTNITEQGISVTSSNELLNSKATPQLLTEMITPIPISAANDPQINPPELQLAVGILPVPGFNIAAQPIPTPSQETGAAFTDFTQPFAEPNTFGQTVLPFAAVGLPSSSVGKMIPTIVPNQETLSSGGNDKANTLSGQPQAIPSSFGEPQVILNQLKFANLSNQNQAATNFPTQPTSPAGPTQSVFVQSGHLNVPLDMQVSHLSVRPNQISLQPSWFSTTIPGAFNQFAKLPNTSATLTGQFTVGPQLLSQQTLRGQASSRKPLLGQESLSPYSGTDKVIVPDTTLNFGPTFIVSTTNPLQQASTGQVPAPEKIGIPILVPLLSQNSSLSLTGTVPITYLFPGQFTVTDQQVPTPNVQLQTPSSIAKAIPQQAPLQQIHGAAVQVQQGSPISKQTSTIPVIAQVPPTAV